jgi:3-deoxy-D-manno-octulosonic acid kinase
VKTLAHKQDSLLIVYDADAIQHPDPFLFNQGYWSERGAVTGEAAGRGSALFLNTPFGSAVLRQYLRGGKAAKISRDHYVFTGFAKSRPVTEFTILERLSADGLPVPGPLAAMCVRDGMLYRGWILMRMIRDASPLADLMPERQNDPGLWRATGQCIRRFHDHGVIHADLNARNILVDGAGKIHLIDFDRARIRKQNTRAFNSNLKRLYRSLRKVWPERDLEQLPTCWRSLQEGYGLEVASP